MLSKLDLKFQLIAEVIKTYRTNSEERAMADLLLYLMDVDLATAQSLSVPQLTNVIANFVTEKDDVPLRPRGPGRKTKAVESS